MSASQDMIEGADAVMTADVAIATLAGLLVSDPTAKTLHGVQDALAPVTKLSDCAETPEDWAIRACYVAVSRAIDLRNARDRRLTR